MTCTDETELKKSNSNIPTVINLDDDDDILPWCGSMIKSSSDQERFIPSPKLENSSPIFMNSSNESFKLPRTSFLNCLSPIKPSYFEGNEITDKSHENDMSVNDNQSLNQAEVSMIPEDFNTSKTNICYAVNSEKKEFCSLRDNESTGVKIDCINQEIPDVKNDLEHIDKQKENTHSQNDNDDQEMSFKPDCEKSCPSSGSRSNMSPSYRSQSSSSAQFSSSPIKSNSYNGLQSDIDCSTPNKLSTSPPLSPILWRAPRNFIENDFHSSQSSVNMEESTSEVGSQTYQAVSKQWTNDDSMRSTFMDTNSQPFIERSFSEEISSQDTGYQTYSSSILPNSSQLPSLSSQMSFDSKFKIKELNDKEYIAQSSSVEKENVIS